MGIYYIIIAAFALLSLRPRHEGDASVCLAPSQTVCVNGICILLVFVSHLGHLLLQPMGYEMLSWLDRAYLKLHIMHGQLIVVPFLFYSGYGIATQMMRKPSYSAGFLRNRALPLWLNFLVALSCYLLATIVFIGPVRVVDVLKSMVFLYAFGNPTWFLFCTMAAYFVIWLAFMFAKRRLWISVCCVVGMLLYMVIVSRYRPTWWYDTALMFPVGVIVAQYKDEVLALLSKRYWFLVVVASIAFVAVFNLPWAQLGLHGTYLRQNLLGVLFMLMVMLFTMRVKIENGLLEWLGKHVFPIYMYHMLFFLLARILGVHLGRWSGHLLVLSVFMLTLTVALLYRFWRIDAPKVKRTL